jgi:hypothetical protein
MSQQMAPLASGAGGLVFKTGGVPGGVGRIQIVPFEIQAAIGPSTHPAATRFIPLLFNAANGNAAVATPAMPWAIFRLVGAVTSITRHLAVTDNVEFQTISTGNGANLLLTNAGSRWELFDIGRPTLASLRDYPLVRAPNTLQGTVAFRDLLGGATLRGNSVALLGALCDNLADDGFGAHLPGPYARPEALIRRPVGRI